MNAPVRLPVVPRGSLRTDGSRATPQPADVHGRFTTSRTIGFVFLILLWAVLPWIRIHGKPAVFLDIAHRTFHLFGASFNAQDLWLVFFLVTGVGFTLVYATAVIGRAWCGWACPQTVFLEAFYRRVERWIEGPREKRMRRNAGPLVWDKIWRKATKHALYVVLSFVVAHVFLAYFVSMPGLFSMVRGSPGAHPEAFAWAMAVTAAFYLNFGFFREQVCLIVCPYGRLQSALVDADTVTVGYDEKRGEPRAHGKQKKEGAGDCVDCQRCVVVCPTGIDIRAGLQVDCIACTQCIDACDDVMTKLGRDPGLIRYASTSSLAGKKTRWVRPRTIAYTALYALGAVVALAAFRKHEDFEANLLRLPGPPYTVENGDVRDAFEVHVVNKTSETRAFAIEGVAQPNVSFVIPIASVSLEPMKGTRVPVFITMPMAKYERDLPVSLRVNGKVVTGTFIGRKP